MVRSQRAGQGQLSLCDLYEQHWLHTRHIENERLNLTSLYALLVGGGVIFLFGENLGKIVQLWLLSFLLLLTFVFGIIVFRLGNRLAEYRINADEIAKAAGLSGYLVRRRGGGKLRTKNLLAFIYMSVFIGLLMLFVLRLLNIEMVFPTMIN